MSPEFIFDSGTEMLTGPHGSTTPQFDHDDVNGRNSFAPSPLPPSPPHAPVPARTEPNTDQASRRLGARERDTLMKLLSLDTASSQMYDTYYRVCRLLSR